MMGKLHQIIFVFVFIPCVYATTAPPRPVWQPSKYSLYLRGRFRSKGTRCVRTFTAASPAVAGGVGRWASVEREQVEERCCVPATEEGSAAGTWGRGVRAARMDPEGVCGVGQVTEGRARCEVAAPWDPGSPGVVPRRIGTDGRTAALTPLNTLSPRRPASGRGLTVRRPRSPPFD